MKPSPRAATSGNILMCCWTMISNGCPGISIGHWTRSMRTARPIFLHVASFLCRGVVVPEKALSFHAQAVRCFTKGKAAHGLECGRAFQLGRIGGNCLMVGACTSIRMEDKASVRLMIEAHQGLFGQGVL